MFCCKNKINTLGKKEGKRTEKGHEDDNRSSNGSDFGGNNNQI